jgi:hypothetical protein
MPLLSTFIEPCIIFWTCVILSYCCLFFIF